jgi:hypothetical protein
MAWISVSQKGSQLTVDRGPFQNLVGSVIVREGGQVKEKLALGFAAVLTAVSLYLVPSWQGALTDRCHLAGIFAAATMILLLATRHLGRRGILIEHRLLALFLAGMPLIYVASWLATCGAGAPGG